MNVGPIIRISNKINTWVITCELICLWLILSRIGYFFFLTIGLSDVEAFRVNVWPNSGHMIIETQRNCNKSIQKLPNNKKLKKLEIKATKLGVNPKTKYFLQNSWYNLLQFNNFYNVTNLLSGKINSAADCT